MIIVVADDFTGAAEIAGVGLQYGLTVVMSKSYTKELSADLIVIATDTRSKSKRDALKTITKAYRQILLNSPRDQFLYKKIDSVLRGYVIDEIDEQMNVCGDDKALLVPANPGLGRTIQNGIYYVSGVQLHRTGFGKDPEFPINTSEVTSILKARSDVNSRSIIDVRLSDTLPYKGICVADITNKEDLNAWANVVDKKFLLAGGAEFFASLLMKMGYTKENTSNWIQNKNDRTLFVCGSAFDASKQRIRKMIVNKQPISLLPRELLEKDKEEYKPLIKEWAQAIILLLKEYRIAAIGVHPNENYNKPGQPRLIRKLMGEVVKEVLEEIELDELRIEGGATAYTVFENLAITKFYPKREMSKGVLCMTTDLNDQLQIIVKPGSYHWPDGVWPWN